MQCTKCDARMSHHYCETWVAYPDTDGVDEYVTMKGYWSCYSCSHTVDETDDDYYEPD